MNNKSVLLQTIDLTLVIGCKILIENLNWTVNIGERWCIIGNNGIGKSTLIKFIGGFDDSTYFCGSTRWFGESLNSICAERFSKIRAYKEQFLYDVFGMRAMDLVLAATAGNVIDALNVLDEFGIANIKKNPWNCLSGGEKQKIAIAACIAQKAICWLMDEPLAHLDQNNQKKILKLLKEKSIQEKITWITSIHELNVINKVFTHILLLINHKNYITGLVDDVLQKNDIQKLMNQSS